MTCFCVGVEKYFVLVCGSKLSCLLYGGVEIDLVSVVASKISYFCVRDPI